MKHLNWELSRISCILLVNGNLKLKPLLELVVRFTNQSCFSYNLVNSWLIKIIIVNGSKPVGYQDSFITFFLRERKRTGCVFLLIISHSLSDPLKICIGGVHFYFCSCFIHFHPFQQRIYWWMHLLPRRYPPQTPLQIIFLKYFQVLLQLRNNKTLLIPRCFTPPRHLKIFPNPRYLPVL